MPNLIGELKIHGLKCDAPDCNWKNMNIPRSIYEHFINWPCPVCGAVILTEEDYQLVLRMERAVVLINRWFGWLAWFCGPKRYSFRGGSDGKGKITWHREDRDDY